MDRFLDKVPEQVIATLDAAYYDFAQYFAGIRVDYSHASTINQGRKL